MRSKFTIILLISFIFAIACNDLEESKLNDCANYIELDYSEFTKKLNDPINIISVEIQDDCLKLTLQYGGGCKNHKVDLVLIKADKQMGINTIPLFEILHDSDNDLCKALITNEYSFNISGLKIKGKTETSFYIGTYKSGEYSKVLYKYSY